MGEGGCRCGQVRFRVSGPPLLTMACHCTGCQRMTASAFSLSALHAAEGFEVTAGEPVIGGLRAETQHFFCPSCMSWLFTRIAEAEWVVNVRATMMDEAADFAPYMETYTSEKLAWVTTPAVRSYAKFPEPGDYQVLIGEYAQARGG
jgi:hypothetical protein